MRIAHVGLTVLGQRASGTQVAVATRVVTVVSNIALDTLAITSIQRLRRARSGAGPRFRSLGIAHTLDVEMPVIPVDVSGRTPELFA